MGQEVEVLVEDESLKQGIDFRGRNAQYWNVNFSGNKKQVSLGDMVKVCIGEISGHALKGRAVSIKRGEKQILLETETLVSAV